ncbi:S-adenosylmethionine decarboxylase proenzyme [Candidatus Roizmanbacteria bacterium RIFCSPLOWO2_02_FULL_43_10]|uniref:S-adenosylmethionine decarboxylase proenzyme n=2 Tax=Candidatus Roizmaniibacteriota TaxID=1752723 RepID=A0A1F7JW50_9BACT|nr:MAG: S-adenosylmethionine decarboxylase proenzyme [Candidatus Roizmanbacteria bacterium RIFCSPHIGHO2_02_FULL_43_11]OGK59825.1 MAG: S-adenosylmethionine decarboxylase proenzyme [Candidatus Roizmanbacteria bacterium RIFCSPLOWO2_02_FULL_43_10]
MAKKDGKGIFGPHLMLDMYGCDVGILNNLTALYVLLEELPKKMGMRSLIKPYIVFAEGNSKRDPGGWSGFVIIQESHISLHTFPEKGFLTADIYSCKPFDTAFVVEYFKRVFKTEDIDVFQQNRGLRFP